jgi:hypothetical protein
MLAPKDAWQATLGQLQLQLNRSTFDTWLKGSEVLAYEDGEFMIRVRHAYAKDWLDKHLKPQITQTLGSILKRAVQVNFVVYLPNRQRADVADVGPLFSPIQTSGSQDDDPSEKITGSTPGDWPLEYAEWDPRVQPTRYRSTGVIRSRHLSPGPAITLPTRQPRRWPTRRAHGLTRWLFMAAWVWAKPICSRRSATKDNPPGDKPFI